MSGALVLARREAAVMGRPLDVDPTEAILECVRIAAGEVAYASERISELDADQAVGAVITTRRRPLKEEKGAESLDIEVEEVAHEAPALHIWIATRHVAMDRLVNYSKIALAAGIEERKVRVAEAQGQLFAQVIRSIVTALGHRHDDPKVREVVRRELTVIAGQAA